jgi:ribose/xylose/arabinose/galactoside ABC-type transport system permease subunit
LVFLALLVLVLSLAVNDFLTRGNLENVLAQVSVVGIVALALNQVILSGEIDISVGSALAVTAFVMGVVAESTGGVWLPLVAGLAVGGAIGAVNGVLSTWARVPSIIATLGMLNALRGGLLLVAASTVLNVPPASRVLGEGSVGGVSLPILILVAAYLIFEAINRHSTWGREVFAVGGNEGAARYAGLRVRWIRFRAFVAVGICTGLAGAIYLGQIGQIQATAATGFELQAIAAVVVGGTSITGGRGSTVAPLVGAVLIGVILNALTLLSVPPAFTDLFVGALILLAISTDALTRRLLRGTR